MKKIIIALAAIVLAAVAFFLFAPHRPPVSSDSLPPVTPVAGPITMAMVETHATATSCWTVIDSNVYDLTGWIPLHPGGERAIESLCGKDGSQPFHNQHDHAQEQATILAHFKIGTLSQ